MSEREARELVRDWQLAHSDEVRITLGAQGDLWQRLAAALDARVEATRRETAFVAADIFSEEIDGLGVLEKLEFAQKIERRAAFPPSPTSAAEPRPQGGDPR